MFNKSTISLLLAIVCCLPGVSYAEANNLEPSRGNILAAPSGDIRKPVKRVTGYVLTHEHPTQGMAFGGNYAFAGAEGNYRNGIMEKGYTANCGGCKILGKCDHGEVKGNLTAFLGTMGEDMGDHKSHMGPLAKSFSHLRYSTEWIREAFSPSEEKYRDTRARIMVAFAVDNESMCEQLYYANKGNGGAGGAGYPCSKGDSFESMQRQINSIKSWVQENSSWMQIAYNAKQARDIVNNNKLAIILGVESEYAFGAENRTFDPVDRLNRYYGMGVRTFYLAHKINSRLSGADIYMPDDTMPGKAIRAAQAIAGCFYYDDNVGQFPLQNDSGHMFCDNKCGDNAFKGGKITDGCNYKLSEISEANMATYVTRGDGHFNGFNIYPATPGFAGPGGSKKIKGVERNNLGLSHDGERVVREAMLKGMIVNIDHISSVARTDVHAIATEVFDNYPLNALHNKPNERLAGTRKTGHHRNDTHTSVHHEYDFDPNELNYVLSTGGFFGFRMGPIDSIDEDNHSGVTVNCPNTSTESAKMLSWLLDQGHHVGYSLDYATTTEGVHSRTYEKCGTTLGNDELDRYDGHITEGLSHIGVMKKWHKELESIQLKDRYLQQLRNDGVEQFLVMWETSEAKAATGFQIPRQTFAHNPQQEELLAHGKVCTKDNQCITGRCSWGFCADPDECRADSDCGSNDFYCGDPVSGRRKCKQLLAHGKVCTKDSQCATGRCSWGVCADADECRANTDCRSNQFCGDPISGKRKCKDLLAHGKACTKDSQCATDRCSWGFCADADECRANTDCRSNQFCGDPISGKRKCKQLLPKGKACTKGIQCASGKCSWLRCK